MTTKSLLGLFTYKYETDSHECGIEVENARFLKDFGPWKAGDTVEYLGVDFNDCIIYELGGEEFDQHVNEVSFILVQRA
jgi:hypothetical protein